MSEFPLETTRLILRPFEDADDTVLSAYRSDPEVARYQGFEAPFSLEQAQKFIEEMKSILPGTPGEWYQIAMQLNSTGQVIGDCAFHVMSSNPKQAYIGITLARAYHHQGYAQEGIQRLLEYLFTGLNLHRVVGECDVENTASAQLMERLGMRREGHFIENGWYKGAWCSEYSYAMLQREWKEQTNRH